jgi:hypothetical protein
MFLGEVEGWGTGNDYVKSSRVILIHFQNPFSLTIVGLEGVKQQVDSSLLLVYSLLDGKGLSTRWQGCLWQIFILLQPSLYLD